jgi:hypothetical protein
LALAYVAITIGVRTQSGGVQLGHAYGAASFASLRFIGEGGSREVTSSRVMRWVAAEALESLITQWSSRDWARLDISTSRPMARRCEARVKRTYPLFICSLLYASELTATLARFRVDSKNNEHKAALKLSGVLSLNGKIVNGQHRSRSSLSSSSSREGTKT